MSDYMTFKVVIGCVLVVAAFLGGLFGLIGSGSKEEPRDKPPE